MEKRKYYVSVQAGDIMLNQGDAAYELEIEATEEEAVKLKELFEMQQESDQAGFFRANVPGYSYHFDKENDEYDAALLEIYSMIYRLGTNETKKHVSEMGLDLIV